MKAEVKKLFSLEIDDLANYVPSDPDCFQVSLRLIAGPEGQPGEESFDFQVCSPAWLLQSLGDEEVLLLRHQLLVRKFNFQKISEFILKFVSSCHGKNWEEVALMLSRLGVWEFEDYSEYLD